MTDETYTGGASYDGTGSGERSFAEQDGEGRDGIPELFRDAENGSGAKSGEISMGGRDNAGGSQVLRGFLTDSPEVQAALERNGATPLELRDTWLETAPALMRLWMHTIRFDGPGICAGFKQADGKETAAVRPGAFRAGLP